MDWNPMPEWEEHIIQINRCPGQWVNNKKGKQSNNGKLKDPWEKWPDWAMFCNLLKYLNFKEPMKNITVRTKSWNNFPDGFKQGGNKKQKSFLKK